MTIHEKKPRQKIDVKPLQEIRFINKVENVITENLG